VVYTNSQYGWPSPVAGKIVSASLCAAACNNTVGEVKVILVVNGTNRNNYEINKANNVW